ncbi:PPOX class F420-dependent oxidoreductase [Jiangella rhizosphaerae]|uniref:PPOX class F420-dependent oxidoreductase n=1 Tax=Jiangella rhizosphaerae TaxID=2293569 RepID=A0A418KI72_9ACTN|nr:PPOX class F420-dependent oxidoreductase [Jiangella rhizosphaerae]RIQ12660.1 PPOX class F420-dependent oxidoreductase [Jiangella rhizosphaerae]
MTNRFTQAELDYLRGQRLGRLATLGPGNRPQLTPVGVFYDPETETIVVAGHAGSGMIASRKFRNARARPDVAFLVDDLISVDPYLPRALEIRGRADTVDEGGQELGARITDVMPFDPAFIRIHPRRILSRGIDSDPFELTARDVA